MYIYIFFRKWLLWSFGVVERKNPMEISLSQMMSHLHQAFAPSAESLSMPAGTLFAGATPGHQSFVRYQFGRWSLKRSEKMKVAGEKLNTVIYLHIFPSGIVWIVLNFSDILACAGSEDRVTESRIPRRMLMPKEPWDPGVLMSRVFHWSESRGWWIRPRAGWGNLDIFFLGKESFPRK